MAQPLALSLLILVLALCIPQIQGSDGGAQDCCLKYSLRKIPHKVVRSYRKQEPSLGCPISAILFSPRKRSQPELCADPKEPWVQQLMKRLDRPPAPQKQVQACRKDGGASKSGKKGKGSKGCKRTEQPQTPKGP
ncbi:C-C motif chemokine 21 [Lepus europaeus]|uniref:C-C motif chemokine 21 n=1 Tax=Lepus europaeus TaxID=9983 RepID=UPI002B4749AA|nr:C-C motif chemokine 21 [Lepus europaeus]